MAVLDCFGVATSCFRVKAGHVVCVAKMAAAKRKRGGAEATPKKKVKFVENGEKEKNVQTEEEITVPPPVSLVRF